MFQGKKLTLSAINISRANPVQWCGHINSLEEFKNPCSGPEHMIMSLGFESVKYIYLSDAFPELEVLWESELSVYLSAGLSICLPTWCWERLKTGEEEDDRGWDGWMASLTQWTWVCINSGSWWWTGRPGVLQSMGLQRVGHGWATELNWTQLPPNHLSIQLYTYPGAYLEFNKCLLSE